MLPRFLGNDRQTSSRRKQAIHDERGCPRRGSCAGAVLVSIGAVPISIGRDLNVEAVDVDPGDVPVQKAQHSAFRGEMGDGNERGHIAPAAVPDGQPPALGAQAGKRVDAQFLKFHFGVQTIGKGGHKSRPGCFGGEGHEQQHAGDCGRYERDRNGTRADRYSSCP